MEYKWVLRGGKMQRLKLGPVKLKRRSKNSVHSGGKKLRRRLNHNQDLIEERKNSKMSEGEKVIAEFLKNNGVEFIREYYDLELINRKSGYLLFFDFYLPKYKMAIEFDGAYHYKPINGKTCLNKQIILDDIKDAYCRNKKIKLLRIPFWEGKKTEEIICQYFDKHF